MDALLLGCPPVGCAAYPHPGVPLKILAVDPGGTTGFTLWQEWPEDAGQSSIQTWMEEDALKAVDDVNYVRAGYGYPDGRRGLNAIVCENFIIGAGTIKKSREGSNTAIEIIGALRWLAYKEQTPFVTQNPGDVTYIDDAKLKRLGWYTAGPDHARSSTRHLVHYLLTIKRLDAALLLPSTP